MSIIERIQEVKKVYGLSTRALAIKCEMNQPTVDRMLKGINAVNINFIMSVLTAFPEVSSEWLCRGDGEMFKQDTSNKESERINKLSNVIETLQDVIDSRNATIKELTDHINKLESLTKK